jgi:pyruvate,water dikinase
MDRFSHVKPPAMLGTPPAFELGDGAPPMFRAMAKAGIQSTTKPREADRVQGIAGSAGVVRGPARLIHSLAEAGKLQPGDVLVAEFTTPPWTPLFATAAAVVTDTGGVLQHGAVVAREYHIPAVVGTDYATSTFHDGQMVEVDGNAGSVRVVVEEAEHELALAG